MTLNQLMETLHDFLNEVDDDAQRIGVINALKQTLHEHSPFAREPVDCVLWVPAASVAANDYNPNVMAPPERRLLQQSLEKDGYTQPIVVSARTQDYLVIDGFHRHVLGKKAALRKRLRGYLPVTLINEQRQGEAERIAATIRHNRARGQHQVTAMSDIVRDLHRLGWNDEKISVELGMDADEVLRLKQISGLAEVFASCDYSEAWTVK